MSNDRSVGTHRWLAVGVFAGVVLAEMLSRSIPPVMAWLVGGSLIGLVPAGCQRPRSASRIAATTAATATVAALAHWLVLRLAS